MPDIDPQLKELIQAQLDANRIAQSELNVKRRQESATLESISSTEALKQDVRQLIVENRKILEYLHQHALQDDALQDLFEHLAHRIERLESGMMLVLMDKLDSPSVRHEADRIVGAISVEHRQRLRALHIKNLELLEEQAAKYGSLGVPLELANKIEAEKDALEKL